MADKSQKIKHFGEKADAAAEKSFAQQIDDVIAGKASRYDDLKVCDTPQILLDVGCEQLPMLYTKNHLKKAVKPKNLKKHTHGLDKEQLKKLPSLLEEPVMIYDSLSRNDSIVVVTSELDLENDPIIVSIQPNGEGKYNLERIDSNFITSVHGRENFVKHLEMEIEADNLLFADKTKSQELFSVLGLQFPKGLNNFDFNYIIHQSNNIVKTFDYICKNNPNGLTITDYTGSTVKLVIPTEIDGKKVTAIGENAFANFTELIEVTVPENVSQIDEGAFYYCDKLENVKLPDGLKKIAEDAFYGCTSLSEITIPKGCTCDKYAFSNNTKVTSTEKIDHIEFTLVNGFYETYGNDAIIIANELNCKLLSNDNEQIIGIADWAIDKYISVLEKKGYTVELHRSDPKNKTDILNISDDENKLSLHNSIKR